MSTESPVLSASQTPATQVAAPPMDASLGSPGLAPAEGGDVKPAPKPLDSSRIAQLVKKEQELQRQREAFKSEREKFAEIKAQIERFTELKGKDPVQALKTIGFSETDLFNYMAAQQDNSTPEERAARAAQAEIKKFQDEQARKETEAAKQRNEQAITGFKRNIAETISTNPDKYEYCNHNGPLAEELIYETVAAVFESEGTVISAQEAADLVESYYENEDKAMNTLKKRQPPKILEPSPSTPPEGEKPQVSPRPSPTLSSKATATVASTTMVPRNETPDQKKARLIAKYLR